MEDIAVWWLSEDELQFIGEQALSARARLPLYIVSELASMGGRPKRTRLWVPPEINFDSIICDPRVLHAEFMRKRGGIVIHSKDAHLVQGLPGYLTDSHMEPFDAAIAQKLLTS